MPQSKTATRIAVCQPRMQWSGDANAETVVKAIHIASAMGAEICAFPELVVPGFHRQIASLAKPEFVDRWLKSIEAASAATSVAVTLGAPTFGNDGRIYNSQVFISEEGERLGVVEKSGLTAPELTFFARGNARPVMRLQGRATTAVICREIEDHDEVCQQLSSESPELIFWPGLMSPEAGTEHLDPPRHVQHAQRLAERLGAFVIQSNWPNALNYPEMSHKTGRSAVVSPDGTLLFRLPQAEPGVAVFALGTASYEWRGQSGA